MPNDKSKPETINALKESLACANKEAHEYLERCQLAECRLARAETLMQEAQAHRNYVSNLMNVLLVLLRAEFREEIEGLEK